MENFKERVTAIIQGLQQNYDGIAALDDPFACMSRELNGNKGGYIVFAGVFNYWGWEEAAEFSKKLSKEFETRVLHTFWNNETEESKFEVFFDGKSISEMRE